MMKEFVSVEDARTLIDARLDALSRGWSREEVVLSEALGRVAGVDVHAEEDFPGFESSAMDGFAMCAADAGADLTLVGESRAGVPWDGRLNAKECVRISTGAPIPSGADAVAPLEWLVDESGGRIKLSRYPDLDANIRAAGADLKTGEGVLERGEMITPAKVVLLAMIGNSRVVVARKPMVSILSTGDELVPADTPAPLPPGSIRDSNGPGMDALVRASGGETQERLVVADRVESLGRALRDTAGSDVTVLTGGISVGPHDHVRSVLQEAGGEMVFWRIRQRPGKPMAFAMLHDHPVFCLPGNPVSAAVCFLQYVKPALERLMGATPRRERATARAGEFIQKHPGLQHFVRGIARFGEVGCVTVTTTGPQGSNLTTSMDRANCLIHLEESRGDVSEGELVSIEWIGSGLSSQ